MPSIRPSLIRFALYFFIITCAFGLVGMMITQSGHALLNQILSFSVLLPYLISFYLMATHFVKTQPAAPTKNQRWKLSLGSLVVFWFYSFVAITLNMWMSDTSFANFNLNGSMSLVLIIFLSMILFFNFILFILGYWFLGKPTQIMHQHFQRTKS